MARQVPIPSHVYHLTKLEWLPSIMSQGLIPGANRLGRFEDDPDIGEAVGVYVTSDWECILLCGLGSGDETFVLLEVDITGIEHLFEIDTAYSLDDVEFSAEEIAQGFNDVVSWYTLDSIPTERITVLGQVIGSFSHWEIQPL